MLGMGEFAITTSPGAVLCCIGLGSCIAVCMYDRLVKVGGMIHIVLPHHAGPQDERSVRYANVAVPFLLEQMIKKGGVRERLTVKIAGGAQMTIAAGLKDSFRTGEKNLAEIKEALQKVQLPIAAADTGGNMGRTVRMYIDSGKVAVKTIGGNIKEI